MSILQSYGVETAKDLKRKNLAEIPNLGSSRVKALLGWRQKLEQGFNFDPSRGVDPMAIATVENEIDARRAELVQVLAEGPTKLKDIFRETHQRRTALKSEVDAFYKAQGISRAS